MKEAQPYQHRNFGSGGSFPPSAKETPWLLFCETAQKLGTVLPCRVLGVKLVLPFSVVHGPADEWICRLEVNGLRQGFLQMESPRESCLSMLCLLSAGYPQSHISGQTEAPVVLRVSWNPLKQRQG